MKNIAIVLLVIALAAQTAEARKAQEALRFRPMHTLYGAALDISEVLEWRFLSDRSRNDEEYFERTEQLYKISSELHDWLAVYGFYEAFGDEPPNSLQCQFLENWRMKQEKKSKTNP